MFKHFCCDFQSYFLNQTTLLDNFLRKGLESLIIFSSAFNFAVARKFITENIRSAEGLVFEYKYRKFSH